MSSRPRSCTRDAPGTARRRLPSRYWARRPRPTSATGATWSRGCAAPSTGDEIELESKSGAKLEAELDRNRLEGTIEVNDEKLRFAIAEAEKPAGLYRAKSSKTTIGWIVLPDGSQVGIQTTGGESSAAPELDPDAPQVSVDGEQLDAEPVSGAEDL